VKPAHGWKTARRLLDLFGTEGPTLAGVFALVLGGSALGLLIPLLIGWSIDALVHPRTETAWLFLGALLAAYVTDSLLSLGEGRLMARLTQRIVSVVRGRLFEAFTRLPAAFFDKAPHGDLMSRMTNDVDNLSTSVTQSTLTLLGGGVQVMGILAMMVVLSPLLTLTALLSVVLVLSVSRFLARRTRAHFRRQQALLGQVGTLFEESLTGLEVIHAFGRQTQTLDRFRGLNAELQQAGLRAQLWSGLMMPLMNVIGNLSFALVAWVGGVLAFQGAVTVGVVATFLIYSRQFSRPINDLANVYNTLQTALAGAERIFAIWDQPPEPADRAGAVELVTPRGRVDFEEVEFSYRPGIPVLQKVTFSVPEGSSLALVGSTGCGKTTVVNLLMRFYEVTGGRILIDGTDLREYTRASLRRHFGVVLQEAWLFRGTIEQNIAFGRPGASADEVRAAALQARADVFVRQLPLGYQTVLTENGSPLSQGQRQLVAIARALLADPAFLLLDEATSNVDTRTELLLQTAVREAMKGRTSVLIAHRLSTIRDADRILVLDQGRIVESGTHDELLALGGAYESMLRGQRGASDDEAADRLSSG